MKNLFSRSVLCGLLALAGSTLISISAQATPKPAATLVSFFGGKVSATLQWSTPPSASQSDQLSIGLKTADGQPYDIDPSMIVSNLYMTQMPEMGSQPQTVVSVSDAGGNTIPGSFMIDDMTFGMSGSWTLEVTLPNPDGSGKTEKQNYQFKALK